MQNSDLRIRDRITDAYRQLLVDVTAITAVLASLIGFCLGLLYDQSPPVKATTTPRSAVDQRIEDGTSAWPRRNRVANHQ